MLVSGAIYYVETDLQELAGLSKDTAAHLAAKNSLLSAKINHSVTKTYDSSKRFSSRRRQIISGSEPPAWHYFVLYSYRKFAFAAEGRA